MVKFNEANFNSLQETARKINEGSAGGFNTKEGIKAWLDKMGIEYYTVKSDLTVNVNDDVDLSDKGLTKIPVQFGKVKGKFDCSRNQLVSLKGAPSECGVYFDCSHNKITSLKFAPQKSPGFHCQDNELTSLEGAPERCRFFNCDKNQLTSLKFAPRICSEEFHCQGNQLKSLEGAPQRCDEFYCHNNQLTSLKGAPKVCSTIDCYNNKLTSLDGIPKECENFDCSNNPGNFTKEDVLKVCKSDHIIV